MKGYLYHLQGCSQEFRLGGLEMHNVDLCQKRGTYAMAVSHCQNQLGPGGAVRPQRVQGRALVGVLGTKPPEAPEILHFLLPENGLKPTFFPALCPFFRI